MESDDGLQVAERTVDGAGNVMRVSTVSARRVSARRTSPA
jgi:hypothetical protein